VIWALGLLAASSLTLVLVQVFPVSSGPPSRFASALLATTEFAILAHLSICADVGVVTLCVLAIVLKRRSKGAGLLLFVLAVSLASVAVAPASWEVALLARRASLRNIQEHAVPIVFGVAQFEKEQGRPPLVLEELVPAYMDRVPNTGLRGCPGFEYEVLDDSVSYAAEAGGWELRVPCGGGMLNWDT
jgi:hypothetical protein